MRQAGCAIVCDACALQRGGYLGAAVGADAIEDSDSEKVEDERDGEMARILMKSNETPN